jgi:hypothetical protein
VLSHFQMLLEDLPGISECVAALESPNPEDDRSIKFAIVGYSYFQPITSWGSNELKFVTKCRQEVVELGVLWTEFVCLAIGYMLGMYQAGKCDDRECGLFEAQLPGFMWLHSNRFTAQSHSA